MMSQIVDDNITIIVKFPFHSSINYLGSKGLTPVLQLLEASNFPKPVGMEYYGKSRNYMRKKRINSYLDPLLLGIIEPNGKIGTHISLDATHNPNALFHIYISQTGVGDQLGINIGTGIMDPLNSAILKTFFLELVHFFPQVYLAQCFFSAAYRQHYWKHIEGKYSRHNHFQCLVWLQYIGLQELTYHQGGKEAFEKNPLLKTSHLHDGLLVEVGNSPYDIFTDEGETLLLK
jgi:hypothetical protein